MTGLCVCLVEGEHQPDQLFPLKGSRCCRSSLQGVVMVGLRKRRVGFEYVPSSNGMVNSYNTYKHVVGRVSRVRLVIRSIYEQLVLRVDGFLSTGTVLGVDKKES